MGIALCIVGIVCIAYGFVIMSAASGTPFFAVWFVLGGLFILLGWGIHANWFDVVPAIVKRATQIVGAVAVVLLVVTQALALSGFSQRVDDDLDYIIVLGAQVKPSGPSVVLQYRLDTAYDYLVAHPGTLCIVSGGQGANEPEPEAHVMARYLEERGINSARIIVEDASTNTTGNIVNCMELIDAGTARVGIVTNNFHMYRALGIAHKKGLVNACGIVADSTPLFLPNNLLRESFGIVKDFAFGNL